jgi:hypothetical protein
LKGIEKKTAKEYWAATQNRYGSSALNDEQIPTILQSVTQLIIATFHWE